MKNLVQLLLVASLIFFSSCEKEPIIEEVAEGLEWSYGMNEFNLEVDGAERNFIIHVPQNYTEDQAVPIVIMLHGSSGNGTQFHKISRWPEKAEVEGFIAVFPTALAYKIKDSNQTSTKWSSDGLPEEVEAGQEIKDDIPFIEGLLELCSQTFNIDSKRLYISGFSNGGGFIKSEVLPRLSHVFAACSAAGGIGHPISFTVDGDRLPPFYNITGTRDDRLLEKFVPAISELPLRGEELMKFQLLRDQIGNTTSALKLTNKYTEESTLQKYNSLSFKEGASGQGNEFVLTMVKGLEHKYPNEINNPNKVVAANLLWEWFEKWSL